MDIRVFVWFYIILSEWDYIFIILYLIFFLSILVCIFLLKSISNNIFLFVRVYTKIFEQWNNCLVIHYILLLTLGMIFMKLEWEENFVSFDI